MRDGWRLTRRSVLTGLAATLGAIERSAAQDWPARPVKVIVPYPPAGGADTVSRILFAKLSESDPDHLQPFRPSD